MRFFLHFSDYLLIFAALTLFNSNKQPADAIFCKAYTHDSGAVALLSKGAGREDGVDDVLEGAGTVCGLLCSL
jgi:hypothetical protein